MSDASPHNLADVARANEIERLENCAHGLLGALSEMQSEKYQDPRQRKTRERKAAQVAGVERCPRELQQRQLFKSNWRSKWKPRKTSALESI